MQDQVRQALNDLISLSQHLSSSDQERILETIERFRRLADEDDIYLTLRRKL